jgi:hypothetical protein
MVVCVLLLWWAWEVWDDKSWASMEVVGVVTLSGEEWDLARQAAMRELEERKQRVASGAQYVRLSGVPREHKKGALMGVYERVEGRHEGGGRGVYRHVEGGTGWMWWHSGEWRVKHGEENVGTGSRSIRCRSNAAVVEEAAVGEWKVCERCCVVVLLFC